MSKAKTTKSTNSMDERILEERRVKALEKISASLDALSSWFEGIDKAGWDDRIQFYLGEWHKNLDTQKEETKQSIK